MGRRQKDREGGREIERNRWQNKVMDTETHTHTDRDRDRDMQKGIETQRMRDKVRGT